MSTHKLSFSIKKRKWSSVIPDLHLWDFSKGLKQEFKTAMVNEPPVFEPLTFYCLFRCCYLIFLFYSFFILHHYSTVIFKNVFMEGQNVQTMTKLLKKRSVLVFPVCLSASVQITKVSVAYMYK